MTFELGYSTYALKMMDPFEEPGVFPGAGGASEERTG